MCSTKDWAEHFPTSHDFVWERSETVPGRRFFANGGLLDQQFQISREDDYVYSGTLISTGDVSVVADPVGNFVVAYRAYYKTYSYTGYAPCYDQSCLFTRRNREHGDVAPAVFKLNDPSQTETNQIRPGEDQNSNPEIVSLPTGEFVVSGRAMTISSAVIAANSA